MNTVSIISGIIAAVVFGYTVLYITKRKKEPDRAMYWGRTYNRKVDIIKGEVVNIRLDKYGNNICQVYFPTIDGYANLSFEDEIIKEIRDEDKNREDEDDNVSVVALVMGLPRGEYLVSVPAGQAALLSGARINPPKTPEYDVDSCDAIQDKIKNISYECNALLTCAFVMLLLFPFVSVACSLFALFMASQNKEFGIFTKGEINGIIWIKAERGRGAVAVRKPKKAQPIEAPTIVSETDKIIREVKEQREKKDASVCPHCGCILENSSDWVFCPYCAEPLPRDHEGSSTEEPAADAPGTDIPTPDDDGYYEQPEDYSDDLSMDGLGEMDFDDGQETGEATAPSDTGDRESRDDKEDDDSIIDADDLTSVDSYGREVIDVPFVEL